MPKAAFLAIFEKTIKNAGYLCSTSIHAIRRQLGKKVDGENFVAHNTMSRRRRFPYSRGVF
jgi:hypothetical protein